LKTITQTQNISLFFPTQGNIKLKEGKNSEEKFETLGKFYHM
jgi:hypothetical protein